MVEEGGEPDATPFHGLLLLLPALPADVFGTRCPRLPLPGEGVLAHSLHPRPLLRFQHLAHVRFAESKIPTSR